MNVNNVEFRTAKLSMLYVALAQEIILHLLRIPIKHLEELNIYLFICTKEGVHSWINALKRLSPVHCTFFIERNPLFRMLCIYQDQIKNCQFGIVHISQVLADGVLIPLLNTACTLMPHNNKGDI